LVKGLRKAGAKTLKEANQYLEREFLAFWRARFGREPASPVDAHRPLGERPELHSILSHVEMRRVANDYTVSWNGKHYQIPREGMRPGLRSSTVRVEGRLDGTVWVRVADRTIEATRCERSTPEPVRRAVPGPKDHNRGGRSAWMKTFDLKTSPPVWKAGSMASRTE
jgi:hypothetical protein